MSSVVLSPGGLCLSLSIEKLSRLKNEFKRDHFIVLKGFLSRSLLEQVLSLLEDETFTNKEHIHQRTGKSLGTEMALESGPTVELLDFLLNDPKLYEFVSEITGCQKLSHFFGRVYRVEPEKDAFFWHDDVDGTREASLSICLNREVYTGGRLEFRTKADFKVVSAVESMSLGDAVLFRVHPDLEHRVTRVESGAAKVNFAGWYRTEGDYWKSFVR